MRLSTLAIIAVALTCLSTHNAASQLPDLPKLPFGNQSGSPFSNPRHGRNPLDELLRSQANARVQEQYAQQEKIRTHEMKVESYWYLKRLGQAEHAKDHAKKRAARDKYLDQRGSGAPAELGANELDRFRGRINWPTGLTAGTYAADRAKIEKLFTERAQVGNRPGLGQDMKTACTRMEQKLRANVSTMTTSEYLDCRKFLQSLQDESRKLSR